jgi:hypothetical protein
MRIFKTNKNCKQHIYSFLFVINFTTKKSDEGEAESVSSSSQRHTHQEIYRGLLAIVRAPPATTRLGPKIAVFHTYVVYYMADDDSQKTEFI